jgi:phosphate:Na+ symporter
MDDMSQKHALLDHQLPGVAATTARAFRREVRLILNIAHEPCTPEFTRLQQKVNQLSDIYHELKDELLRIGAQNRLDLNRMVSLLDYYSHMRMMCEQAVKGTIHWTTLRTNDHNCSNATDNNNYAWKPQD